MNKYFFIMLLVLLLPIVQAAQPIQVSSGTMQIDYPKYDIIKQNNSHRFHVHVINSTSSKINTTTSCLLHVYDTTGYDITSIPTAMEFESYNGVDYALTVDGRNFSTLGFYSYVIQCNSSSEIAFASGQLLITPNGLEPAGNSFKIFIYILFIVSMIGLILTMFLNVAKLATASETLIGVLISWGFYILLIVVSYLGGNFLIESFVRDISNVSLSIFVWTNMILPVISLILTMIIKSTKKKQNVTIDDFTGRRFTYGY